MFSFFRRGKTAGKHEDCRPTAENSRTPPNDRNKCGTSVRSDRRPERAPDEPSGHATLTGKDVVNLLIPSTDYNAQKTGVGAIFHNIMAGNRKRNRSKPKNRHKNKNGITRAESYREIPAHIPDEMQANGANLYRSHSQLDKSFSKCGADADSHEALSAPVSASDLTYEVIPANGAENNCANETRAPPAAHAHDADPASFVRELVLQKYKNKSPVQAKRQHVSLVYVSSEPPQYEQLSCVDRDAERQHAEALLREIAKRIDCDLNDSVEPMGASDSKSDEEQRSSGHKKRVEINPENEAPKNDSMNAFKDDLRNELEKLLQNEAKTDLENNIAEELLVEPEGTEDFDSRKIETDVEPFTTIESPGSIKKSNLKPPRSDTEGCSDDDRSDCGKKKVTFRKTIDFDDGDQQTDDEVDSSFESLASSEEEEEEESEEEDDAVPDNDELLGGVVVARTDDKTTIQDDDNLPIVIAQINETNDLCNKELYVPINVKTSEFIDKQNQLKTTVVKDNVGKPSDSKQPDDKYDSDKEEIQRLNSDNSDSGFLEISEKVAGEVKVTDESETESETEESEVTDSEVESDEEIIAEIIEPEDVEGDKLKSLVAQEDQLQSQVTRLSELASARGGEADRARDLLAGFRKEIEANASEIERLKCDLAAAYKESELVRQRSRSLEDELNAARSCSAELAGRLGNYNGRHLYYGLAAAYEESELVRQRSRSLEDELNAARSCSAELAGRLGNYNGRHLYCVLAAAYEESELVRQRSRSLEDELNAARSCSAELAGRLGNYNGRHLYCGLAAAYEESELIRQRSRSLEDELNAARSCSAELAGRLGNYNGRHVYCGLTAAYEESELIRQRSRSLEVELNAARSCSVELAGRLGNYNGRHLYCGLAAAYEESELIRPRSRSLEDELNAARSCSAELAGRLGNYNGRHLYCGLAAAYEESELIRQRSRSLEDELNAARSCSAELAGRLGNYNDGAERALRSELAAAQEHAAELDARVAALEGDRARLELERRAHEQRAQEAVAAAEASSTRWRAAHEAARSQAAARAERLLDDCEWKMRELERRARDAERLNGELSTALQNSSGPATQAAEAELQQLRATSSEQQRSLQALTAQLQRLETREEALKLEVHRLKELLEKQTQLAKETEERHQQAVSRLEAAHAKRAESLRAELHAQHAAARGAHERAHAERTRAALAQLRAEHERDARNRDRKLREAHTRFENLKEVLASKERQFEEAIAEAHSKSDWDVMQLRHMLDKADITYANGIELAAERHEAECERLNNEWGEKLRAAEEAAAAAAGDARAQLEATRASLEAERRDQVARLKESHRMEMDSQWEQFMSDKEECLARMKLECRQEGEEERTRREKDMLEEIAELKGIIASKSSCFDELATKAASCGRTLAVTEQELREALEREKALRTQRSEDADKIRRARGEAREEVEHLTRKCACLRKLFDDMRAKLAAREKASAEEARVQQREIQRLKAEVARLTKILVEQSSPKLGARTRADGCDCAPPGEPDSFFREAAPPACEGQPSAPRRKGGTLRTPELPRRRPGAPEPLRPLDLADLKPVPRDGGPGRRRAKSVDLPAVQVPCRIRQLEDLNK